MKNRNLLMRNIALALVVVVIAAIIVSYLNRSKASSTIDMEMTQQLRSENNVMDGQVYFQKLNYDYVFAAVVMKNGTSSSEAKRLAEKYAVTLKAKYKEKKVNVQAVSINKKNLANIIR